MHANEGEQRILLICIRFGSCEVRRLNLALPLLNVGKVRERNKLVVVVVVVVNALLIHPVKLLINLR